MRTSPATTRLRPSNVLIVGTVFVVHALALWTLQGATLRRSIELVVPIAMLSEIVSPPAPVTAAPVTPTPRPAPAPTLRQPAPRSTPVAGTDPTPAPQATATETPAPAPAPAALVAPFPSPAPAKVELPSKDADYLHNPPPAYPSTSYRLGEQGLVVVRVLIGVDGAAQDAKVQASSGYPRLDEAALKAARGWRYVPGRRGGVPEAMWVDVPVRWELQQR